MLLLLIFSFILNSFAASEQELKHMHGDEQFNEHVNYKNTATAQSNNTYIDKAENMLLMPTINKFYEEHKNKRKYMKKSPKRTIQKIIKKNRIKLRKMYVNMVTSQPTMPPKAEYDNNYAQEELAQWKDDSATTQSNQKRKPRKWNPKMARNPMPFQKMQSRREMNRRNKRSDDRDDVFILKDLDEVEFLDNGKDYNVVKTHVKKYW